MFDLDNNLIRRKQHHCIKYCGTYDDESVKNIERRNNNESRKVFIFYLYWRPMIGSLNHHFHKLSHIKQTSGAIKASLALAIKLRL